MATPKSVVFQLYKHWDIIEALTQIAGEWPVFEQNRVLSVIAKISPASETDNDHLETLHQLCHHDILQPLDRSHALQFNPLVLDFTRGLTHEHELGLSSVLKARIEGVKQASAQLNEGLSPLNYDLLRRAATQLSALLRQLKQQLEQDKHAIIELAEQAKSQDAAIPIQQRYSAVLDAYDDYVEPMNEMMDSSLSGTFYPYLEKADNALDAALEALSAQGSLYTHQMQLRHVAHQAKDLQCFGRIVAQQCANILLPLREEARQHNSLSASISHLLGRVRKQGLQRGIANTTQSPLPLWRTERFRRVNVGGEILTLMADAMAYIPEKVGFPDAIAEQSPHFFPVDEAQLHLGLQQVLPVENLMIWLQQHYLHLPDATLLRLYHDLVREPLWQADLHEIQITTRLHDVEVTYYPHRMSQI